MHLSGFLKTLHAGEVMIGLIFGVTGAAAIVARPPMGRIMDRRGRVAIIRAGGALHVIACLLYTTIGSAGPWAAAVRVTHGVAEAMLFTSLFAYASDIVPASRRFEGIALFGVSGMLPVSGGSLLGDLILSRTGGPSVTEAYRPIFLLSVALSAAAFLISLPLRDPEKQASDEPPRNMLDAFLQRDLLPLWIGGVVFATCLAAPFTFFATFVLTEDIGTAGLFFSCYSIAAITLRVFLGKLPERAGPKRVLFPAMCAVAAGPLVLAFARSAPHVAFAGVLAGMGHGFTFPILLGLVVSRARPAERGAALAIFTAIFDAGSLLGNPLFGLVVKATHSYRVMFAAAAAVMAAGTAVFGALDRGRR